MKRFALGILLSTLLGTAQAGTLHVTYHGNENSYVNSFLSGESENYGSSDHIQGFNDSYHERDDFKGGEDHDFKFGEDHDFKFGEYCHVQAVPEPETYAMMLAGLGLIGFMARRRNKG